MTWDALVFCHLVARSEGRDRAHLGRDASDDGGERLGDGGSFWLPLAAVSSLGSRVARRRGAGRAHASVMDQVGVPASGHCPALGFGWSIAGEPPAELADR
jgi:hypothetical protein